MKTLKVVKYLITVMGLGSLAVSLFFYNSTSTFLKDAARAEGTVVELNRTESKTKSSDGLRYETSVSYKPVVNFVTAKGEKIELVSIMGSNPPMYHKGQKVEVLYLPAEPHKAEINDFFSLWGIPVMFGVVGGVFFLVGGGMMLSSSLKARSDQYLRKHGMSIKTEFQRVVMDTSLTVNGRHPFRILTQWQNPSTSAMHIFQSNNLWYDPTSHIKDRQITVFIERNNPKKYFIDLSFLPKISD